jgi:hypothetical protein
MVKDRRGVVCFDQLTQKNKKGLSIGVLSFVQHSFDVPRAEYNKRNFASFVYTFKLPGFEVSTGIVAVCWKARLDKGSKHLHQEIGW